MKACFLCRVCARVALYNGHYPRAEQELQQAIGLQGAALPAWEGLAMLQQARGDTLEAAETYEKLVCLFHMQPCVLEVPPDTRTTWRTCWSKAGGQAGCCRPGERSAHCCIVCPSEVMHLMTIAQRRSLYDLAF